MKATIRLKVSQQDSPIETGKLPPTNIDGASIDWEIKNGNLESISISFSISPNNLIDDETKWLWVPEDMRVMVFRIALYLSNRMFMQTGIDSLKLEEMEKIMNDAFELIPESSNDEQFLKSYLKRRISSVPISWAIRGRFDPSDYGSEFKDKAAYALYADAERAKSPFQKFKQFFEVIEYYFPTKKNEAYIPNWAEGVAVHLNKVNPSDKEWLDTLKDLRKMRTDITHPDRGNHLHPGEPQNIIAVNAKVPLLKKIAYTLIENPPSSFCSKSG